MADDRATTVEDTGEASAEAGWRGGGRSRTPDASRLTYGESFTEGSHGSIRGVELERDSVEPRRMADPGIRAGDETYDAPGSRRTAPDAPFEAPGEPSAEEPSQFFNRELSLLEFNRRVLEQARDPEVPLLERLRYLTISTGNLDEFFEVRVAGLLEQIEAGIGKPGPDGLSPQEALRRVRAAVRVLVADQYRVLNDLLLPALESEGIRVLKRSRWSARQRTWVESYFRREVLPVLTPMGLDPAHPFPKVLNKSLNFIVSLEGRDAFGRDNDTAVVQAPRVLPRLIPLPREVSAGPWEFILLTSIIHAHVGELFQGMEVTGCHQFRVTRNSDVWVDDEEVNDLLRALKRELQHRNFGDVARLEVTTNCTQAMVDFLVGCFGIDRENLLRVDGPVNLNRLSALYDLVDRPDLKFPAFVPGGLAREGPTIFDTIRGGDVLLHHPYESFAPVVDLVREAAADPNVMAIKQTLYRTERDSPLAEALLEAAAAGKEVTAVIELRARFDEAANIELATRLQELGAKVSYGVVGYKTHAKMLLVVRREGDSLRRYVHVGTGNYHTGNTRNYTDVSLLTCNEAIGEDVHYMFQELTGLGKIPRPKKLLDSPFSLHRRLLEWIDQEAEEARAGRPAWIAAKMNALIDPAIIQALYRASTAGVRVDLVVRGICCLRPGVAGLSENVRVRSIIGRFLEHSRIFHFHAGGRELTYFGSADWMPRNFFGRIEVCCPVDDPTLRDRVLREGLTVYLEDDTQAWELQPDGTYRRAETSPDRPRSAQRELLQAFARSAT
ncbi:MAG: polyphosphate kinase [Candidatus Binatota bacterium]|nr:polyphosphate kinase [Candidatus Binatota bacterium]